MKINDVGLGSMQEWGVPVRAAVGGSLFAGRNEKGEACLYTVMGQESSRADMFILQIDIATGTTRRFNPPPGVSSARPVLWSERWGQLFIGGSALEHHATGATGWLLAFDPRQGCVTTPGLLRKSMDMLPVSVAEGADGTIYAGCHPDSSLFAIDPSSGRIRDLGRMDPVEHYAYVACGADGTVAVLVKMTRPHVVVCNPSTGEHRAAGPVADTDKQTGHVNLVKAADGMLYIDSHEGWFRLSGMEAVPVKDAPAPMPPPTLPDGSTFRFLDGHAEKGHSWHIVEILQPHGKKRVIHLDYQADGAGIYIVRGGPDGRVYGSSILPMHFFAADPATGVLVNHGACSTASGEVYSMDWLNGRLYMCVYTHALLMEYDPARPYSFSALRKEGGEFKLLAGEWDPAVPLRFRFGPGDNPRQLGRMDLVAYRARDMIAGPAGKVWVASMPDYGMWGGTLSWYDPARDTFGGAHRHILPDCSPIAITHLPESDRLVIGFCIYGGSGTVPRADRAGFALWDPVADRKVWVGDLGTHIIGVMDLENAGNGLTYAIVHPAPESILKAELMLIDFSRQQIVSRTPLADIAGWPLEVSFQRDGHYLYGATRESIYRVPLGTTEIEILWRTGREDGPTAGGALVNGRYFFGCLEELRSVRVK